MTGKNESATVRRMNEPRTLHAIMIELCAKQFLAVRCWPDREPEDPCCRLKGGQPSWLDLQPGNQVLLRQTSKAGRTLLIRLGSQIPTENTVRMSAC